MAFNNTPQYPYNDPYYGNGNGTPPRRGKATASLVLGIISLLLSWMGWISLLSIVLALIGAWLGLTARRTLPRGQTGRATAGLVLCILALVLSALGLLSCLLCYNFYGYYPGYWDYYYYW